MQHVPIWSRMGHLGFCVIQNINENLLRVSPSSL